MKKSNLFAGLVFILLAVCVIGSSLGWFEGYNINIFTIIFTIIFAGMFIKGIVEIEFAQIFFSVAFLCILYRGYLDLEEITPFPVLAAALLATFGFNLIFKDNIAKHRREHCRNKNVFFNESENVDFGDKIYCGVNFGSATKYANGERFKSAEIECNFGDAKLYLQNAILCDNVAHVYVNVRFGDAMIFVPKEWKVNIIRNGSLFSEVKESGYRQYVENSPEVNVHTSVYFGEVKIEYI